MTDALPADARFAEGDFRVGRVFNRAFSVLSRNLLPFCFVTIIASLPNLFFFKAGAGAGARTIATGNSAVLTALGFALVMVLSALSQAIILYGAFEDMRGNPVRLSESFRIGLRRFFPVIGVAILVTILTALAAVLVLIPGLIVAVMLFVSTPVCVVERLGPIKSMGRSAELTKGHRWKIFGLLLVTLISAGILQAVLVGGIGIIAGTVAAQLMSLVWSALWGAFYAILAVVTYHDLRVAKEGLDTDQIAAVFD